MAKTAEVSRQETVLGARGDQACQTDPDQIGAD